MRARRIIAATLAAALTFSTAAAFSGCANNGGSGKTSDGKVILKVLTNRTDRKDDGALDKMTDAFEEENNCVVEYVAYADYDNDVATIMSTDDYGDVLCIPANLTLEDLPNYFIPLGTHDELSQTYRWTDKKMTADGNVYGLATGGTATGVLYNKKVWSEAGITELPTTPDEFIEDLKTIAEKTDSIPYYTNYKDANWTISQWQNLVTSAAGGAESENLLLSEKRDLFGEGNGYYEVYKLMYDIFSIPEILEEDHMNTEWESSKVWFGEGKIATMVMGSWAVAQFMEKAENKEDIGYMPVPITAADGKQYAEVAPDYTIGVSSKSKNQDLAKKFVTWFISDSGYSEAEGMINTRLGSELPDTLEGFANAEFFEKAAAPSELVGVFDKISEESGLNIWGGEADNFKIKLAEAAFAGKGESEFEAIIAECNEKWAAARDSVLG